MRNKGLDLRHHSFGRAVRGLDETEVLSFLQATAPDYEQAHAEVAALRRQVDDIAAELKRLQEQERTLTRVLVAAEEDARVRLEGTAKQVAEIERKAEERVRALVANAEAQRARMQDEVRAILARRSIAANGLTELIDGLSRRSGQAASKPPVAAAPPAPAPAPPRIVQPVAPVAPPVSVVPSPAASTAPVEAPPVVTVAGPAPVSIAQPPAPAPPSPPAPAAEPIAEFEPPVTLTASPEERLSEAALVSDAPLDVEHVAAVGEDVALVEEPAEQDQSGSKRAWWVAAAGIVLAVTTAAAVGLPHLGGVADKTQASTVTKPKAIAPTPTPKSARSDAAEPRPAAPAVAPAAAASSWPLTVTLKANRECWLRLVVDGHTETKTLAEGEELSRGATREIELRVGDAAAIAVTVNGRPLAPLGRSGQVIDTVFHPDLAGSR